MHEFFDLKVTIYSPRNNNLLRLPNTNTPQYDMEALCFIASERWITVPNQYKNLDSLDQISNKLKWENQLPVPANYVKHIRCLF